MGFGKDGKGVIITQADLVTLGTLANNAYIKQAGAIAISEDFRLIKVELAAEMVGGTGGESPLHVYLTNDELTVAEVAEAITVAGPVDRNDRVAQEQAERAVFLLGSFRVTSNNAHIHGPKAQQAIIEKTIRWTFSNPEGWSIGVFNQSGGTLTTGAVMRFVAKYFGVWVV